MQLSYYPIALVAAMSMALATAQAQSNPFDTSADAAQGAALFQTHRRIPISSQDTYSYDVSADGHRFLIATQVDESAVAPLSVLLNWTSAIEK